MVNIGYLLYNAFVFGGALIAWNEFCSFLEIDLVIDRNGFILFLLLVFIISYRHPLIIRRYLGKLQYPLYIIAGLGIIKFLMGVP